MEIQQDKNKEIQGKIQGNTTQDTRKYTAKYKKIKSEVQGNTRHQTPPSVSPYHCPSSRRLKGL